VASSQLDGLPVAILFRAYTCVLPKREQWPAERCCACVMTVFDGNSLVMIPKF